MRLDPVLLFVLAGIVAVALALAIGFAIARARYARSTSSALDRPLPASAQDGEADQTQLPSIADWLGIGLMLTDSRGAIALANDAAHRCLGRRDGTLRGLSTIEAFVDHRIDDLVRAARSGPPVQREISLGGEPQRTLLVRARSSGQDSGAWIALEDVSELRRLQRIRTEFIDNLSHELRTPLATVRILTEVLAGEQELARLPPRVRDSIVKIDVETGHLVQMVDELLDLSRIEQGESSLQLGDVDLGAVVDAVLERLGSYAERQGVGLRSEVPATADARTIRGDRERLGQVVVNLVHNAVKFSNPGGEVVVRVRPEAATLVVEVEDHGVGIPRAELGRIFERFYKVDRARQRGAGGTGLGLAIARHVVERHGGRIRAESTEGVGSRFIVTLPRG